MEREEQDCFLHAIADVLNNNLRYLHVYIDTYGFEKPFTK